MRLLTVAEVSEMLRTPEATIRYWRHTGRGPASFKIGRRVLYKEEDVTAWLHEQSENGRRRDSGQGGGR